MIQLIINECIKIFKKKLTVIFFAISIISLFIAYGIVNIEKNAYSNSGYSGYSIESMKYELDKLKTNLKTASDERKTDLNLEIEFYEYAIKNNIILNSVNGGYKATLLNELLAEKQALNYINQNITPNEYKKQKEKVDRIQRMLDENDFNGYIAYNKEKIETEYKNKSITEKEYRDKIEEQDLALKYEIDKDYIDSAVISWKKSLLLDNTQIKNTIERRYDSANMEYLSEEKIKELEEKIIINTYRLDNNLPAYYKILNYEDNSKSFYRWKYNTFAIPLSMFFIAVLAIMLASSSISEETSKGTIKFLVIAPFKRYKILLSKLISYLFILMVFTLAISQVSILFANLLFSNAPNEYLFVNNNNVEIMSTQTYETLQYLLKLPEIIIYILIGVTLSSIFRNTIVSNTITLVIYIAAPVVIEIVQQYSKLDFLRYLPFTNFNLTSKVLPIYDPTYTRIVNSYKNTTLEFSLVILCITCLLLLVTMFESFNKKDIT